jgi:oxygen-dependent protoporphyrinogen oxidase
MTKSIAIIGGGITGLSAAFEILTSEPTTRVTLFESTDRLGGVIQTRIEQGRILELGADNFATLVPDALNLCREIGYEDCLIRPNPDHRFASVLCRGKTRRIPAGFSLMQPTRQLPILTSPILSLLGRFRLLRERFVPRRMAENPGPLSATEPPLATEQPDPANHPGPTHQLGSATQTGSPIPTHNPEDESLESFAVRRLGREAFDRLVEPIVGGIFTAEAAKLSLVATLPQFPAMEQEFGGLIRAAVAKRKSTRKSMREQLRNRSPNDRSRQPATDINRKASGARYEQFRAPTKGMQHWIDAIAGRLASFSNFELRTETRVLGITKFGENRWTLRTQSASQSTTDRDPQPESNKPGADASEHFDAVVLTSPAAVTSQLLSAIAPVAAENLANIEYASSVVVGLVVPRAAIPKSNFCFGVVVPRIEGRDVLAISFTSEKYPGRLPRDSVYLRVFMGGAVRPELNQLSDRELIEIAWKETCDILRIPLPDVTQLELKFVTRWPKAMPQYNLGHLERVDRIEADCGRLGTVQVAGAALRGVGIPQCVQSGRRAARQVLNALSANY